MCGTRVQTSDPNVRRLPSTYEEHEGKTPQSLLQPESKMDVDHSQCESYASTVVGDTATDFDDTPVDAVRAMDRKMSPSSHEQAEVVRQTSSLGRMSISARRGVKDVHVQSSPGAVHSAHMFHLGLMSMALDVPLNRAIIAYKHAESILRSDLTPYTHRVLDLVAMDGSKHTILPSQLIRTIKELTSFKLNGTRVERDDLAGWAQLMAILERGLRARSVLRLATLKVYMHHEATKSHALRPQKDRSLHISNTSLKAGALQHRDSQSERVDDMIQENHFACPFDINNALASAHEMKKHKDKYRKWRNQGKRLRQISETAGLGLLIVAGNGLEKM